MAVHTDLHQLPLSLSSLFRSSAYCSDIAKVNGYPVLHVNGDYPEVTQSCLSFNTVFPNKGSMPH